MSDSPIGDAGTDSAEAADPSLAARLEIGFDRFLTRFGRVSRTFEGAVSGSRSGRSLERLASPCRTVIASSWIVRWLTRPPDADVIEIDLATTRTVGPVIRLLARLENGLAVPWESSGVRPGVGWISGRVSRYVLSAASVLFLAALAITVVRTGIVGDPLFLAALAIAAVAALLGLAAARSSAPLRHSTARRLAGAFLAPPEDRH